MDSNKILEWINFTAQQLFKNPTAFGSCLEQECVLDMLMIFREKVLNLNSDHFRKWNEFCTKHNLVNCRKIIQICADENQSRFSFLLEDWWCSYII
jgi:hypothetical protein